MWKKRHICTWVSCPPGRHPTGEGGSLAQGSDGGQIRLAAVYSSHMQWRRATQGCAQGRVACRGHGEGGKGGGRGRLLAKTVQALEHGSCGPGEQWENKAKENDAQRANGVGKEDRSIPDGRQVYLKPTTPFPVVSLIFKITGSTCQSLSYENRTCVPLSTSHLDTWAVIQQIQVWGEGAGVWLCGEALPLPTLHVHSSGVDGAPSPQEGTVAEDALDGLGKQRLQRGEEVSGGSEELLHTDSLLSGFCFQRLGKKIHHFRLQTNGAGIGLR